MDQVWDKVMKCLCALLGAAAGWFGGFDKTFYVLLAFMVADYVTGMLAAWLGKSLKTASGHLDSKVGFVGLVKKGLMLLVVLVAAQLDKALGAENFVFRSAVTWFYLGNEGLSLVENLALIGVPFPAWLKSALEQIRKKNDENAPGGEQKPPDGAQ